MQFIMTNYYGLFFHQSVFKSKKLTIIMLNYKNLSASCREQKIYLLYVVVIATDAFEAVFPLEDGHFLGPRIMFQASLSYSNFCAKARFKINWRTDKMQSILISNR